MRNRIVALVLICLAAAGCQSVGSVSETPPVVIPDALPRVQSVSAELARENFNSRNFALAERNYREAVESNPSDFGSWVGLAASYDRLGRFALADRAYDQAIRVGGETIEVLNNRGYSYLLRGDRRLARSQFERALQLDPTNPVIANNILLLSEGAGVGRQLR